MTKKTFTIKKDIAIKYLVTYVADDEAEWMNALGSLANKFKDKEMVRQSIAATILLPVRDRSVIPEVPYNLLFWIHKYSQFPGKDWVKDLEKVVAFDEAIVANRGKLTMLGCVDPIEYAPYPRQALRWLTEASKDAGDYSPAADSKFRSLIHVYGGVAISNVFKNEKTKLPKILNWRSHYFFERLMHRSYSIEQLINIKKAEISKTNQTLVVKP